MAGLSQANVEWDVFISHASEDKDDFVRPLAHGLEKKGLKVWFDEFTLRVGDSLRRSIDDGLSHSRFGIVVISSAFLRKDWPQRELDGLVAREIDGVKVTLPVWHNITADLVRKYSPILADRLAVSSSRGLEDVIAQLLRAMEQGSRLMPDSATLTMQPAHLEAGTTFQELRVGHFFRFHHGNEAVIGFKAIFNYANPARVALVLTPTKAGPQPGDLLSTDEVQDVVQLNGVRVIPSKGPGSVSPGAGNFAEPGEIELRGQYLIFVARRESSVHRVNLQSGEIGHATGARPAEIYSEWSLVQTDGNRTETLYKHQRAARNGMTEPQYGEFLWIETRGDEKTGHMYLSFGKPRDDLMPFVLTVTPSYVARKTQKTLPLNIIEVQNYCSDNRDALRKVAFNCKQRGKNAELLQ